MADQTRTAVRRRDTDEEGHLMRVGSVVRDQVGNHFTVLKKHKSRLVLRSVVTKDVYSDVHVSEVTEVPGERERG